MPASSEHSHMRALPFEKVIYEKGSRQAKGAERSVRRKYRQGQPEISKLQFGMAHCVNKRRPASHIILFPKQPIEPSSTSRGGSKFCACQGGPVAASGCNSCHARAASQASEATTSTQTLFTQEDAAFRRIFTGIHGQIYFVSVLPN